MALEIDMEKPPKLNQTLFKDDYSNKILFETNIISNEQLKFINSINPSVEIRNRSNPVVQFIKMIVQSYKNLLFKDTIKEELLKKYLDTVKADLKAKEEENEKREKKEEELLELKNQLIVEVSDMISKQETQRLNLILKKGYELTNEQCLSLLQKEDIFNSDWVKNATAYNLKNSFVHRVIEQFNSFSSFHTNTHEYFRLQFFAGYQDVMAAHFLKSQNILEMFCSKVDIYEILENNEVALSFLKGVQQLKHDMKEQKISPDKEFEAQLDQFITHIETHKSDVIEDAFNKEMSKYDDVLNEFNSIKEKLGSNIIDNIRKFTENDLPKQAQEIIRNIKSYYKDISLDSLPIEHKLDVELLYNKRFPQVIEEYITISPRYKEKLILHNESPDQLLLDSLTELSDKLKFIVDSVEEKKHNQMKVTRQYLRNK